MNRIAGRAGICLLLVLALLSGLVFFLIEYAVESEDWVISTGSPHVHSGSDIIRRTVKDRDGVLLLDISEERIYAQSEEVRKATVHWIGDRKGNIDAPAVSVHASELTDFNLVNGIYTYGGAGVETELTLSTAVQTAALEAMGDYKGTVGVYNYKTGELICAVTTPNFDPDNPPVISEENKDAYDGLYVNRFTKTTYIPGSIFKIVTLAAALESIPDIQQQQFVCNGSYQIGSKTITCDGVHHEQDLKMAFRNSCNSAFAQISQQLGKQTLQRYVDMFGVTKPVTFDGITTKAGNFDLSEASLESLAWSSIGQYTDLVNPCSFMTFLGAIAAGGKGVNPYLVQSVSAEGDIAYHAETTSGERIMSAATAETIREYMGFNVTDKYGSENFPGLTVCAKTGTAEVGGEKKPNAMLTGFVADEQYPLAFVVMVEDGGYGREICVPILSKVLAACVDSMDKNSPE